MNTLWCRRLFRILISKERKIIVPTQHIPHLSVYRFLQIIPQEMCGNYLLVLTVKFHYLYGKCMYKGDNKHLNKVRFVCLQSKQACFQLIKKNNGLKESIKRIIWIIFPHAFYILSVLHMKTALMQPLNLNQLDSAFVYNGIFNAFTSQCNMQGSSFNLISSLT